MIPKMNVKGFNLFTALISFLLIMLAVLLIQSMIQTERNAADTIASIESRNRLEATAEMARADAMQVFNYALRRKIEDWLTDPDRGGLTLQLQNKTWDEIQKEFAESKFGGEEGSQFAKFTASSLEGIFYSPSHFGNYTIALEGSATLENSISKAITKSVETGDFFTVIQCNGDPRGDNCPLGTFYVNLHLEKLTQEEYENLPKLHIVDRATGEELKEIILPRTTFRIYVPLRFFKAIAEARALTHFPLEATPNTTSDKGLFSPMVHNEIELMALGMCDFGYCAPRTDPLKKPPTISLTGAEQFCPGDSSSPNWGKGLPITLTSDRPWFPTSLQGTTYNANNNDDYKEMKDTLEQIARAKVCTVLKLAREGGYINANPDDEFLADEIEISIDARFSKLIGKGGGGSAASDPGRGLGLFTDSSGEVDFPHIGGIEFLECSNLVPEYTSKCAEVKSVRVTLGFREDNPNYMVKIPAPGEERVYKISVYDNTFVPFTANWTQGTLGSNYLYSNEPSKTDCSMLPGSGWYCETNPAAGDAPPTAGTPTTIGCKSAVSYSVGGSLGDFPGGETGGGGDSDTKIQFVVNEGTGKNCDKVCNEKGFDTCKSIGLDEQATDGKYWTSSGKSDACQKKGGSCSTKVNLKTHGDDDDKDKKSTYCFGRRAEWTRCRCETESEEDD